MKIHQRVLLTIVLSTCVASAYAQNAQPYRKPEGTPPPTKIKTAYIPVIKISQEDKMIQDLKEKMDAGEDYRGVIANNPKLYNEYNVTALIKKSLNEKYLSAAYNDLSQAELITGGMEGDTAKLEDTLVNTATQVKQRPANVLLDRIKTLYKDNKDISDEADTGTMFLNIVDTLIKGSGIINSQAQAEMILGTAPNLFRDGLLFQSSNIPVNKDLSDQLGLLRVQILENNKNIPWEGHSTSIADVFTENVPMNNVFCGNIFDGNTNLTELTKGSDYFKLVGENARSTFSMIQTHIELDRLMKIGGGRY
jgi:hypothetical protein